MLSGSPSLVGLASSGQPLGRQLNTGLGAWERLIQSGWCLAPSREAGRQKCLPGSGDWPQAGVALPLATAENRRGAKVRP